MSAIRLVLLVLLLAAAPLGGAQAAFSVFACEPEWAALAKEIGGDNLDIYVATTAKQDPHQIQARPSLIARTRGADLVVCSGAELEVGWMPVVLRQSANSKVQPGSPGYFAAADYVKLLEVPSRLDRSEGDIHAAGNPHIQTSPKNFRLVSVALARKLADLDPPHAAFYADHEKDFLRRWDAALANWEAKAAPLKGVSVAVYHKGWVYLMDWLGMKEALAVEPKPGVPPGASHIAELVDEIPKQGVRMVLYASYEDGRPSQAVAERAKVPSVMLPATVGGTDAADSPFTFFDDIVNRLLAGLAGQSNARS
jgi:zinc/manganese transport system substrate-binding protein